MKIAIVVQGRFHSFDLARALIERGHDVTIFTNYPKWAVERFGVPKSNVRSYWVHGVLTRALGRLHEAKVIDYPEPLFHQMFGRWARAKLMRDRWDVVHLWSGVAEEIFLAQPRLSKISLIMRGSAHINIQAQLLAEEERRTNARQDKPSEWMVAREEREYQLADKIIVLSTFAYSSFVTQGIPAERLRLLPLGARLDAFRPQPEVIEARCQRILSGQPLQILYVGALSFRKGLWDLAAIARELRGDRFSFQIVGPQLPEAASILSSLDGFVKLTPKQPQAALPAVYAQGDVFVFPTIEDGFAVVLAQAAASGLPILTTTNCSGPDLIREGENGWVVPIRSPEMLIDRLKWCDAHRQELAAMVQRTYAQYIPRDWSNVAADFEAICLEGLNPREAPAGQEIASANVG